MNKFKILFDYGSYEGMKFYDEKTFSNVDDAVKFAVSLGYCTTFLVVQVMWDPNSAGVIASSEPVIKDIYGNEVKYVEPTEQAKKDFIKETNKNIDAAMKEIGQRIMEKEAQLYEQYLKDQEPTDYSKSNYKRLKAMGSDLCGRCGLAKTFGTSDRHCTCQSPTEELVDEAKKEFIKETNKKIEELKEYVDSKYKRMGVGEKLSYSEGVRHAYKQVLDKIKELSK